MKRDTIRLAIACLWVSVLTACGSATTQLSQPPPSSEIVFTAERDTLQPGECTSLSWDVEGGFGVTLNGDQVPKTGETEVCPEETQRFELSVDLGTRLETRTIQVFVNGNPGQRQADEPRPTEPAQAQVDRPQPTEPAPSSGSSPEVQPGTPAFQVETWVSTGGPPGGLGYDIRMDPRNPDVMYVTDAWAGVFKSTDGGENWVPINNGITTRVGPSGDGIPAFSLTIDPNNPDILWVGTQYSSGTYRSEDAGQSWTMRNNGIQEQLLSIRGFTVQPGNSDVVYLSGEISSWEWNVEPLPSLGLDRVRGAIYKTTDGGQNWRRIWYGDNLARYVWIHPQDPNLLYASTGIFDREAANSNPETLDPGGVGLLRSRDGGATWEALDAKNGFQTDELYFGSLFMHPQNPNILLAAAGNDPYMTALGVPLLGAIYLTEDGGDRWERVLGLPNASTVEICTGDPNVMYAGSRNGIYRSMDGGHTWAEMAGNLWGSDDVLAGFPIDMQCDPRDPLRLFVNNYIGGNFLSEDGGLTWRVASKGYTGALMSQIAVSADDPGLVYSASRMGIFASDDGGENWGGTAVHPARVPEAVVIAVDPFDGDHIMAVFRDAGPDPFLSRDRGRSWTPALTGLWEHGNPAGSTVTRITFSAYTPNLALAAAGEHNCHERPNACQSSPAYGIVRSTDGARTWERTGLSDAQVFDLEIAGENLVYAAAYPDLIYRSTDGGQTWEVIAQGISFQIPIDLGPDLEIPVTLSVLSIAVDPSNPNRLFAGFYNGGLMTSSDGGQTWAISAAGLIPEMSVSDIEPDPVHPGLIYLGSPTSGVYYSTDSGETWMTLNDGLGTRAVVDLALSADGSVLYAATSGGGVFRLGTPASLP